MRTSSFLLFCVFEMCRADTGLYETITSSVCGDYHYIKTVGEAYVTYNGAPLDDKQCSIEFMQSNSFQETICVKPLDIQIGCSTTVEYYRHFISEYLEPEVRLSCRNSTYNEWCGAARTSNLFIVFKTSGSRSHDIIRLHVYLKDLPGDDWFSSEHTDDSSTIAIIVLSMGLIVIIVIVVLIVVCVSASKRRQAQQLQTAGRSSCVYQTTAGPVNIQIGQGNALPMQHSPQSGYQPVPQGYQPRTGPQTRVDYQLHPMQSAYPVPSQQRTSPVAGYHPAPPCTNSFATAMNPDEVLPPSYEQIVQAHRL